MEAQRIYAEVVHMSKESSFDIVSKVDLSEVTNAVNIALKEIQNRYDLKEAKATFRLKKMSSFSFLTMSLNWSNSKMCSSANSLNAACRQKHSIRKSGSSIWRNGASTCETRPRHRQRQCEKINTIIKNTGLKVKSQIQEDQIRVSGKVKTTCKK